MLSFEVPVFFRPVVHSVTMDVYSLWSEMHHLLLDCDSTSEFTQDPPHLSQASLLVLMSIYTCSSVKTGCLKLLFLIITLRCLYTAFIPYFSASKIYQCNICLNSKMPSFRGNNHFILLLFKLSSTFQERKDLVYVSHIWI